MAEYPRLDAKAATNLMDIGSWEAFDWLEVSAGRKDEFEAEQKLLEGVVTP